MLPTPCIRSAQHDFRPDTARSVSACQVEIHYRAIIEAALDADRYARAGHIAATALATSGPFKRERPLEADERRRRAFVEAIRT